MNRKTDEFFMMEALKEARKAGRLGEVPVGAVVVYEGKVLSRGHNRPIGRNDPTAHAEVVAIRKACAKRKNYRLPDCELYVTIEPCAMCLGAIVQARIKRLVYGAPDKKAGAVESILKFPFERTNHRIQVKARVLAGDCAGLLREFFSQKRKKPDLLIGGRHT